MERNQFYYTRREPIRLAVGETGEFIEFKDSFNVNNVIRSLELEDKRRLILLNDIHERVQQVPVKNTKGKFTGGYKNERITVQSEIYLSEEDSKRYIEMLSISN